jgi:hypothetical protein
MKRPPDDKGRVGLVRVALERAQRVLWLWLWPPPPATAISCEPPHPASPSGQTHTQHRNLSHSTLTRGQSCVHARVVVCSERINVTGTLYSAWPVYVSCSEGQAKLADHGHA